MFRAFYFFLQYIQLYTIHLVQWPSCYCHLITTSFLHSDKTQTVICPCRYHTITHYYCICCFIEQFFFTAPRSFWPLPRHPYGFKQFTGEAVESPLSFWQWTISAEAISTGHIRQFTTVPKTNRLVYSQTKKSETFLCAARLCVCGRINQMFLKGEVFTQWESHPPFMLSDDNAATSKESRVQKIHRHEISPKK